MTTTKKIVPDNPKRDQICDFWKEFDKYIAALEDKVIFHEPAIIEPITETVSLIRRKSKIIIWEKSKEAADDFISECEYISCGRAAFNIQVEKMSGDLTFSKKTAIKSKIYDVDKFVDKLKSAIDADEFRIVENEELKPYQNNIDELEREITFLRADIETLRDNIETIIEWSKTHNKSKLVRRRRSGDSYRVSFYDPTIAQKKQANIGDLLIVIADKKPNIINIGKRKSRSDCVEFSREHICDTKFGEIYDVKSEK